METFSTSAEDAPVPLARRTTCSARRTATSGTGLPGRALARAIAGSRGGRGDGPLGRAKGTTAAHGGRGRGRPAETSGAAAKALTALPLTILSVDGVGAYDHISRQSMLSALASRPDLAGVLPFASTLYGSPSTYLSYDKRGIAHEVRQGEGGEQGDPLMPCLFALGQHEALQQARHHLHPSDALCDHPRSVCLLLFCSGFLMLFVLRISKKQPVTPR